MCFDSKLNTQILSSCYRKLETADDLQCPDTDFKWKVELTKGNHEFLYHKYTKLASYHKEHCSSFVLILSVLADTVLVLRLLLHF